MIQKKEPRASAITVVHTLISVPTVKRHIGRIQLPAELQSLNSLHCRVNADEVDFLPREASRLGRTVKRIDEKLASVGFTYPS